MSIQHTETQIIVNLREMLHAYEARTGERMTYQLLADRSGIARSTIESLAARPDYNASLRTIAKICSVLGCGPGDLLSLSPSGNERQG